MNKRMLKLLVCLLAILCLFACGASAEEATTKPPRDFSAYSPKITTLENGVQIQKVPDANMGWGWFINPEDFKGSYNTYFLNAENRGCSACHDLEDTMRSFGHVVYHGEYPAEDMPVQNCVACHSDTYSGFNLQQPIHSRHLGSTAFNAMNGTCESCHYIDEEGNYLRWDFVKYDVMRGMTDIAAEDVNVSIEWNQDQLTDEEDMMIVYWDQHRGSDYDYTYDYIEAIRSENIRDTYAVSFSGDMDNPCELTIQEMIDRFGTVTRTLCGQCSINGAGGSLVYQCEVTGIPMDKICEYLGVHENANTFYPVGIDNYAIPVLYEDMLACNGMLVFEMNGHELSNEQGYPIAYWCEDMSCGVYTRNLAQIRIVEENPANNQATYGPFVDVVTGYRVNMPNIGVLTAESGQIFTPGQPVHLEGFAHAFEEPIAKLEFSFDHGATWVEVPTEDTANERWVYWKMDINDLDEGAYLLCMRASSIMPDGSLRVNQEIPKFLINVK